MMGELSPLQKSVYWFLGIGFLVAAGVIYTTASDLNLLLPRKRGMHLGVDVPGSPGRLHCRIVLTGLAVSVSGSIGYVGLFGARDALHVCSDHRTLLPTAASAAPLPS